MSLITWNCQGAAKNSFYRTFKLFASKYKPTLIDLFERTVSGAQADKVITKLGFHSSHRVEAS